MPPDQHSPDLWDTVARTYDGLRPDQGLTDPPVRAAWRALLTRHLPTAPASILDAGCGTGSLSLLLAEAGYRVTGIDFAPVMIATAREKALAAGLAVAFDVADASAPRFPPAHFDAIVCRQVLWALPDRAAALRHWAGLLREGGRLILVEGRFASGRGMSEAEIRAALPPDLTPAEVTDLSGETALWGGPIPDQRLLVVATRRPAGAQASR
jgi:ubiquinone/menaquinone biosynthesis C-methylase UbiE